MSVPTAAGPTCDGVAQIDGDTDTFDPSASLPCLAAPGRCLPVADALAR